MLAEIFDGYSGLEKVYLLCAIVGGVLFIFRLILQFIGGDAGDTDLDIDGADGIDGVDGLDGDTDFDASDSDYSFKVLSLQAVTAFLMMFGLVGLAILKQGSLGAGWSLFGGTAAGSAMVWVLKKIFEAAMSLQSSGTMDLKKNAIGEEGTVYLTIPEGGTGKVRVAVQNHLKVFNARAEDRGELKTGEEIKVVNVVSNNILVVNRLT
jgi:membrane protein implicated in regulation of membrane protease activity